MTDRYAAARRATHALLIASIIAIALNVHILVSYTLENKHNPGFTIALRDDAQGFYHRKAKQETEEVLEQVKKISRIRMCEPKPTKEAENIYGCMTVHGGESVAISDQGFSRLTLQEIVHLREGAVWTMPESSVRQLSATIKELQNSPNSSILLNCEYAINCHTRMITFTTYSWTKKDSHFARPLIEIPLEPRYFLPRAFGVSNSDTDLINEDKVMGGLRYKDIKDLTPNAAYQYDEARNKHELREARKGMAIFGVPISVPAVSGMVLMGLAFFLFANLSSLVASLKRIPVDQTRAEPRDAWIALSEVRWIGIIVRCFVISLPFGAMVATACVEFLSVLTEYGLMTPKGGVSLGDGVSSYALALFTPSVCGFILLALCNECNKQLVALQCFASSGRLAHGEVRTMTLGFKMSCTAIVTGFGTSLISEWADPKYGEHWLQLGIAIVMVGIFGLLAETIANKIHANRKYAQMIVERDILLNLHDCEKTYGELLHIIDDQRQLDVALNVLAKAKLIEEKTPSVWTYVASPAPKPRGGASSSSSQSA